MRGFFGPAVVTMLWVHALPAAMPAAAQSRPPDFSALATTPGTEADRARGRDGAAGGTGAAGKRRLHLEGLGVGYDVNDRLTLKGGLRTGRGGEDPAGSGSGVGGGGGVYLGVRRSLGRP